MILPFISFNIIFPSSFRRVSALDEAMNQDGYEQRPQMIKFHHWQSHGITVDEDYVAKRR